MAYATVADIDSEFKNMYPALTGTDGALTTSEVAAFITQEEAVINAAISNRYEAPVTGVNAIQIMKSISIACVAYRVAKILNLKKDMPIPKEMVAQSLNEGSAYREAKKRLKAIMSGKIVLGDAVALSTTQGIKSYNAENNICPIFKRDTKQW